MIPMDDQQAPSQGRGRTFSEPTARPHVTEILLPFQVSLEVVAIKPARAERHVQVLAIGDRGSGGKRICLVAPLVRRLLASGFLPDGFSRRAIKGKDHKIERLRWRRPTAEAASAFAATTTFSTFLGAGGRSGGGRGRRSCPFSFDCRQKENPIFPDDGGRVASARHLHLPLDILFLTPGRRRLRIGCKARIGRTAPRRPR